MASAVKRIRLGRVITSKHKRGSVVLFVNYQSKAPWQAVFTFLNPLLIGVLQVHCLASNLSPFSTHKANLWSFLSSTFIYCFALAHYLKYRRHRKSYSKLAADIASVAGSLGSVSIVSIFLPRPLDHLVFIIWSFVPTYFGRRLIINVGGRLFQAFKIAVLHVFGTWKWITGSNI